MSARRNILKYSQFLLDKLIENQLFTKYKALAKAEYSIQKYFYRFLKRKFLILLYGIFHLNFCNRISVTEKTVDLY